MLSSIKRNPRYVGNLLVVLSQLTLDVNANMRRVVNGELL